ncbi:hypothetical protein CHS0354_006580 [Potamilus streckersoni]|uniref:Uncharacterized protein n=1 Tax=Potamilus streckersoni TaxID=2493646 RepID=A0AAE0W378_9BIVA|nr:hypothetical protein CHS0354_006580 [Potamilus streckersoni]
MFRTAGFDKRDPDEIYSNNLARIDPKVYLHFLEFICYYRQNKISHKNVALENMIFVIEHKLDCIKDSDLKLLAYCLKQEGKLINAFNVLCKSMKQKEKHNAAKWQIATLINVAFRFLRGGQ